MPAVESSMMAWVEYRAGVGELDIAFKSGKTFTYFGVAPGVYERLLAAQSKGRFFHENIDGAYSYALAGRRKRVFKALA